MCIVLFLLWYFYPTIRQWQDENLGGKMVEHLFHSTCPKRAVHGTESYEKGRKGKHEILVAHCTFARLGTYVVTFLQKCSTLSPRKGPGYLRKNLAAEAKQAIRAAVSWTDAIRALRAEMRAPIEQSCLDCILQAIFDIRYI